MGRSRQEKARSHARIVETAATKFREVGIDGIGVADLMAAAGLTHGGFYSHFESRDQMVAEALECAFAESERAKAAFVPRSPSALGRYVEWYLSPAHRDAPATGCAVAALAGDVGRAGPRIRNIFTARLRDYLGWAAGLVGGRKRPAEDRAALVISAIVGALVLARAVNDEALSNQLMRSVREQLPALLDAPD